MADTVIQVSGLSKQYQIGAGPAPTFREHLSRLARAPMGLFRPAPAARARQKFWALNNVSFDVKQGEVLGIVGRNGAGKSTLLKVLSRITEPTAGTIDLTGRIASLLEVGTGFHGELTGRENVFLNGAILGMSRQEIRRKFDEIVAFAEVEQFIDTAVKHYSSGMYLRLAFAVAAHLESEILIVDEVLAVGDAAFQKRCLGKMEETSHQGRTILFVSHNLAAVNQLCQRALWLSHGEVQAVGPAFDVVAKYLDSGVQAGAERRWTYPGDAPGDGKARMVGARVRQSLDVVSVVDINRDIAIEMDLLLLTDRPNISASFFLSDIQGTILFASSDWRPNALRPGVYRFSATIPAQTLGEGRFSVLLQAYFYDPFNECFHLPDQLSFEAVDSDHRDAVRGPFQGHWPGAVRLRLKWDDPKYLGPTAAASDQSKSVHEPVSTR